ncbi:ER protein big1 [Colletotrichum sojae]|uniref:Protein BIG1 n=1 Tax=Colletotrichum sojae TaxID=2175907 RepID=A0A8H6JHU4_9PEZI|nr:ER protein big1 [Colletotrichum sojae]
MRLSRTTGLMAFCATAQAFTDSSPFVMLSTAELATSNPAQLQTDSQALSSVKGLLSSCPTDRYLIISQPNANAADIRSGSDCRIPTLCQAISGKDVRSVYSVAEVVGEVNIDAVEEHIRKSCSSRPESAPKVSVDRRYLKPLGRDAAVRASTLSANDDDIFQSLGKLRSGSDSYTFIYLSSPSEPTYQAEFATEPLHAELKRHEASLQHVARAKNDTEWQKLPLFEKYIFFSPGIFHTLVAIIILFSILGVGIRALASLEIPHGAFEKEMGPAAQKKSN